MYWQSDDCAFCLTTSHRLTDMASEPFDAIAHNVYLLSLSTGSPHPSAKKHTFRLDHEAVTRARTEVHVSGDYIAIMVAGNSVHEVSELWVLDWKNDIVQLVRYFPIHGG